MSDSLRLLGWPTAVIGGVPQALPAVKSGALVAFLVHQQRWVTRSELLFLLWPDVDQKRAGASLRQILATVARTPWGSGLLRDGRRLRLPLEGDVGTFLEAADGGRHDDALGVYAGPFLNDYNVPDAPEFTAWTDAERDTLHRRWRRVVLAACDARMAAGAFADVVDLARRLLLDDPLDEEAARRSIEASLASGEVGQATRTYRTLAHDLRRELGADPSAATEDLARRLGDDRGGGVDEAARGAEGNTSRSDGRPARQGLPIPRSHGALFGREEELASLRERFAGTAGVWVQLLGPGGIGKTTLAMAVGHAVAEGFDDVLFVAGSEAATGDEIAAGLANAAAAPSLPGADPVTRAELALAGERILVVLDNLDDVADVERVLVRLGDALPNASWLVTTRRRLDIPNSDIRTIGGLAADAAASSPLPPAAALFLDRARRTGGVVDATRDADAVAAAARAVEGHPLAIELAAGWVRLVGLDAAVRMLLEGMPLEAAPGAAREPRHGSIDAVLSTSWSMLSPEQRAALARLTVFQDGCTLAAAEHVAGVDLSMLVQLRDASMLDVTAAGRLVQHPLVERFVRGRAAQESIQLDDARARHAHAYVELTRSENDARHAGAPAAQEALAHDHANVVLAWRWAIEHDWWEPFHDLGPETLPAMLAQVGRLSTWWQLLADARSRVLPASLAACMLEMHLSFGDRFDGRADVAQDRLRAAADAARAFDAPAARGWIAFQVLAIAGPGDASAARAAVEELYGQLVGTAHDGLRARLAILLMATAETRAESDRWYAVAQGVVAGLPNSTILAHLHRTRAFEERAYLGDHVAAVRLCAAAVALHRVSWQRYELPHVLVHEAIARLAAGDLDIALERADEAIEIGRPLEARTPHNPHHAMQVSATARWFLGDRAGARAVLTRPTSSSYDPTFGRACIESMFALEEGDLMAARRALDAAAPHVTRSHLRRWRWQALSFDLADADLSLAEGSTARARSLLHAILPATLAIESVPLTLEGLAVAAATVEPDLAASLRTTVAHHAGAPYHLRRRPELRGFSLAPLGAGAAPETDLAALVDAVVAGGL